MNLLTHLSILQQSEYEWERYHAWYLRHQQDIKEIKPKKKTPKLILLYIVALPLSIWMDTPKAIQYSLQVIAFPENCAKHCILQAARLKLRYLQLRGLKIVAIAGSYAKTSTKNIMQQLLSPYVHTLATPESVNTPLGIALVILKKLTPNHKLFIAELGAYVPGDIEKLTKYIKPSFGILTPIGTEHLERFGSMEHVIETESELITASTSPILSCDRNMLLLPENVKTKRVSYYGFFPNSAYDISEVSVTRAGTECILAIDDTSQHVFIPLYGKHNVLNMLPSFWVAKQLHISNEDVLSQIPNLKPVPHRMEPTLTQNNVLILDNGYNTNPDSSKESLSLLAQMSAKNKIMVTPGFVEMGEKQDAYNREFGKHIAQVFSAVAVLGETNKEALLEGLHSAKFPKTHIVLAQNEQEAVKKLGKYLIPNSVLLFEGGTPEVYQ